jgi:osmotically-inducible protein OsmY
MQSVFKTSGPATRWAAAKFFHISNTTFALCAWALMVPHTIATSKDAPIAKPSTITSTESTNTAVNKRDVDDKNLTPLDQGSSQSDVEITTQIRKAIIAHKTMSVNAQNVKVITLNGKVTLRGPVNTSEEKRFIGEIVSRIVHPDKLDNQLDAKPSTGESK